MQGTSNRAREFSALGRGAKMALLLSGCAAIAFPAVALAQNTTVAAGTPRTTNLNMDADDTLTVDPGASFSVNGAQAVNINAVTSGAGVVITNSGLIEATTNANARAINSNDDFAARNVTITNNASGTIRSTIRNAIRFAPTNPGFGAPGSVIRIDNSGRIETTGTTNAAIEIGDIGGAQFVLTNNAGATIAAAGLQAIISGTASTITNNGTITGVGNSAIVLNGASTITNNGTITGFGTGAIVLSSAAGNTVTLGASSLTQNGNAPGATPAPATPSTTANAVNFTGTGANILNLHAGATVIGRLNGSSTGGDRLNLLAGTGPATLGVVSNFDDIHVQSGDWTQNATISSESGTPLTSVTIDSGATLRWVDSPTGVGGGFLRGAITNNGTFVVGRTGFTTQSSTYDPGDGTTVTVHSVLSGSGDLRIQNGGTFVLTAPNSYTGTTFIENGGLRGDAANVFAPGSAVDIAATGTLNANGFDQTVAGFAGSGRVLLGTAGNSTLTAGGNNASTGFSGTIEQAGNLTKVGSGTLTLSGVNIYTGNTAVSGGTLAIAGAGSIATSTSLALANAGTGFDITGASGAQSVQNLSGAAGSNVQLGAVDLTATYSADAVFAGNIAGSGKFTKAGTGTLTLSGANALTGPFELGLGRLLLTGSVAGDVSALGGTILDGAGTIGGTLTLADNATLNIGNGGVGTLSVGGLILGSTSVLNYDLGAPGVGGASDRIQVNGNLTLDGRLNASDAGGFGAGVYRLIDVTGSVTDNGLSVTGLPAGYFLSQGTVQIAPNQVNLVISATASGIQFWDGAGTADDGVIAGGSGSWTNAATNWTSLDGTTNTAWEGAFGVFQGAAGTVSVDDAIVFDGLQFMTDGYVIAAGTGSLSTDTAETSLRTDPGVTATIAASIGGTGGLSKRDGGTLILSGANTYGGATLVEGGTLQVQGGAAIADGSAVTLAGGSTLALVDAETVGSLAGAGNVTLGATLSAGGNGGSTSYSGAMTGAGGFTKVGAGTMTLAGASSFDGLVTVGQGTLVLSVANALRSGADVQVDTAATLALGANSVLGTLTGSGGVAGGASRLQIDDGSFAGVISGTGNIVKSSAGTLTLAGANAYTGTTNLMGGTLALTGAGSVDATSGFNMSGENSVFDISGANGARTITRLQSAVTTSQIRLGANQLTIVNDGGSLNYLGTITGTGGIRKTGTGQISFNNSNNYAGGTIVEGGTLRAQAVDAFGTGSLDVRAGATVNLAGFGTHASGLLGAGAVTLGAAGGGLTLTGGGDFAFTGVISGGAGLAKGGSGTQTLGGANSYTGATTIAGGTLALSGDGAIAGSAAVALTGAGATLDVSGASGARLVNNLTGVTGTAVTLGGGSLTATYAANGEFAGSIGGSGSFTKAGTGTLTLSGSNGLTGATNVTAGTLLLTGSVGGDATLSGGATLAGTGSIAGTLTAGSGIVEAGGNGVGTLTVGGLVLGADTVLNYDLGAPGNLAASDRIQVGGNLTLDGTVNGRNAGGFGTGVYRLFDYGGTLTDNGLSVGALPAGFSPAQAQIQTAIGGQVNLVIAEQIPDIQFWDGANAAADGVIAGGSGAWTNAAANWTGMTGATNNVWGGNFAVFAGAAGTVTVDDTIALRGMQFMTDGYVIANGSGALVIADAATNLRVDPGVTATIAETIRGTGGIVKNDTGTLILSGANSYAGDTKVAFGTLRTLGGSAIPVASAVTIDGGATLDIAAAQEIGSLAGAGSVTLSGGSLTAGGNGTSTLFSGTISGAGGLTKKGAGTLTLTGANAYTGATLVEGGTLAGKIGGGDLGIAAGATFDQAGTVNAVATLSGAGTILLGGNGFSAGSAANSSFAGSIGGSGSFTKTGTGTLTLSGTNSYDGATLVSTGTLQAASAGALADTARVTVAAGATLGLGTNETLAALDGRGAVALGANSLTVGAGTFEGAIGGTGGVTKAGAGTLTLAGTNSYSGATAVNGGVLAIGPGGSIAATSNLTLAAGAAFDIANGGAQTVGGLTGAAGSQVRLGGNVLTVNRSSGNQSFGGTIAGSGGLTKAGGSTLILSAANSYSGPTTVQGGTLRAAAAGAFGSGLLTAGTGATADIDGFAQSVAGLSGAGTVMLGGATLTVGGAADSEFGGIIIESGTLAKAGSGTLTLSGASSFTGATNVLAGRLVVNGSLASTVNVASGATLGGSGRVGGLVVTGAIAPGNSIGTLNVAGNLTFAAGSTYQVEINPAGASDLVAATGTVTIQGGTVSVLGDGSANFANRTDYTILTGSAVTGTFAGVTDNLAFLDASLLYGPAAVQLRMTRNDVSFAAIGATPNQRAVGAALDAGGSGTLYDAVLNLDGDRARRAFSALSGEVHAGVLAAAGRNAADDRRPIAERLAGASGEGGSAWGDAIIADRKLDARGGYQGMDGVRYGLAGGFEYGLGGTGKIGVGALYAKDDLDLGALAGEAKIDTTSLFVYGGFDFGKAAVRLGAGYSWLGIDTSRRVSLGTIQDALKAKQEGEQWQAFGELAYKAQAGSLAIEPFAGAAFVRTELDAASEGSSVAALDIARAAQEVVTGTAGIRLRGPLFRLGKTPLALDVEVAGEHRFGNDRATRIASFASNGESFTVGAVNAGRDLVRLRLGATTEAMGGQFGFGFVGALSSAQKDYGVRLRARWDF